MPENIKLSVVVPVYNVADFLTQCVDSILSQSLDGIEVILVNDKSPDPRDYEICRKYALENEHVTNIEHEENKGLGGARNTGLYVAKGEYIAFIDSDDWLDSEMFEKLYHAVKKKDADIGQCYFYDHFEGQPKPKLRRVKQFSKLADRMNAINVLAWNKIYKTSLYIDNNIVYPENIASQDVATMARLLYFVDSVALVKEPLYHYRANRVGSITSNFEKLLTDLPSVFKIIEDFLIDLNIKNQEELFYNKRVLKSLTHHLKRFQLDDRMSYEEKNELLRVYLNNSLKYLGMEREASLLDLDTIVKDLVRFERSVNIKIFYKSVLALFK